MPETITTIGTGGSYSNYCANRLPCGICRIMMPQCPVFNRCGINPVPTLGNISGGKVMGLYFPKLHEPKNCEDMNANSI